MTLVTPARFITFEGGEGAGKTTQIARVAEWMRAAGLSVTRTRELGGTPAAEAVRTLFLSDACADWLPLSEALLANTARHEHAERLIKPALARGEWVICDRFSDSTLVYQSVKTVPFGVLLDLQRIALGGLRPGVTFLFDLDPETGFARLEESRRMKDRFETLGLGYHRSVMEAYRALAAAEPDRFVTVDASQPPDAVTEAIIAELRRRYGLAA